MDQSAIAATVADLMVKAFVAGVWSFAKVAWFLWRPYIIGIAVIIVAGVAWRIIMLRLGGHNKLPPGFNRLVGSLTYFVFSVLIFAIAYWIWGGRVIDEMWLPIFGALSFPLTGLFLRRIGFWYY